MRDHEQAGVVGAGGEEIVEDGLGGCAIELCGRLVQNQKAPERKARASAIRRRWPPET